MTLPVQQRQHLGSTSIRGAGWETETGCGNWLKKVQIDRKDFLKFKKTHAANKLGPNTETLRKHNRCVEQ